MATSTSFRIAQATGLLGAAWLSGNIAALSLITIPALTTSQTRDSVSPGILARQWNSVFVSGRAQNPPIAAVAAASFSYLAWTLRSLPGNQAKLYGAAAVLTIGIVPFTFAVMSPTNNRLIKKAQASVEVKGDEKEVGDLLEKWRKLNGARSLLPLVGGALGLFAALL